jgi:ParB/RepB/Spo0J family partition protein
MNEVKLGFEMERIRVPLEKLLPTRVVKNPHNIKRYADLVSSIRDVGMIEPLMIFPQKGQPGTYVLVDGHLRYFALKQLGEATAECLIANDDECFTYNARINRLPPIQAHKMIVKAIHNGVRPERIAAALNIGENDVRAMLTLLDGINEEAADLLKDKVISPKTIRLLKKVTGIRQIEIAELMVSVNNYAAGYCEALILSTPRDQRTNPDEPKKKEGLSKEDIARMEAEMETLVRDFKAVDEAYSENVLTLTVARSYIKKLLGNAKVVRFLTANHADILTEFEGIAALESL